MSLGTLPIGAMIQIVKPTRRAKSAISPSGAPDTVELPAVAVKTKVWLEHNGRFVVGDGGLRLLLSILEHGSLLGAARQIRWSYRHACEDLRRAAPPGGRSRRAPRATAPATGAALAEPFTASRRVAAGIRTGRASPDRPGSPEGREKPAPARPAWPRRPRRRDTRPAGTCPPPVETPPSRATDAWPRRSCRRSPRRPRRGPRSRGPAGRSPRRRAWAGADPRSPAP